MTATMTVVRHGGRRLDERGFFTIWVLGLCVAVLFVGGISLDLWRALEQRRELAAIADAASVAAASHVDLDAFRASPSLIRLDHTEARNTALTYVQQAADEEHIMLSVSDVTVTDTQVEVRLERKIDSSLVRILRPGTTYTIDVTSAAEPRVAS
jgi:Flp pilus assembly protein TadG